MFVERHSSQNHKIW